MYKVILLIALVATSYAATYTMASSGTSNITLATSANSSNSSNYDVVFTVNKAAAALTNSDLWTVACVDTAVSNYTLSAAASALSTVRWKVSIGSSATDFTGTNTIVLNTATTAYATAGTWTLGTETAWTAVTGTAAGTSTTTASGTYSGLTPTQMDAVSLMNSNGTPVYCKTFAMFGGTTDLSGDMAAVSNVVTGNVTIGAYGAAALAGFAATLAYAF